MRPGLVVHGTSNIEWLEGERFLIQSSTTDHPEFPGSTSIIGFTDRDRAEGAPEPSQLTMHYFDSRGVFRVFEVSIDETAWKFSRIAPGFSQRFTGTFADGGDTIVGVSQLCQDDVNWVNDLRINYRRAK
ncbi:MAG: hypothetical protein ACJ790_23195 [Myxococcaceae bacterium]